MHVLYVDDSGSAGNPKENYFVLAGVAIFERRLYHLITALDRVVAGFGLDESHEIELHGTTMYNGRKEFYPVKRPEGWLRSISRPSTAKRRAVSSCRLPRRRPILRLTYRSRKGEGGIWRESTRSAGSPYLRV
jgi:hypothetical protein